MSWRWASPKDPQAPVIPNELKHDPRYPYKPTEADYAQCSTNLQQAELAYCFAYNRVPYTNLLMIEDLLQTCGVTYETWFDDPTILNVTYKNNDFTLRNPIESQSYSPEPRPDGLMWLISPRNGYLGRCTSFALEVADLLKQGCPEAFEFEFYDLIGENGRHRIARCKQTEILVCSASNQGPMVLPKGQLVIQDDHNGKVVYSFDDDGSIIKRPEKVLKASAPMDAGASMLQCYQELVDISATKLRPLCLFRSFSTSTSERSQGLTQFFGLMRWDIHKKQLDLIPNIDHNQAGLNREFVITYTWLRTGNPTDSLLCWHTIRNFCKAFGGPFHAVQESAIEEFVKRLIVAANKKWLFPVVTGPLAQDSDRQYEPDPSYRGDRYASWLVPWKYQYADTGIGWGQNAPPGSHPLAELVTRQRSREVVTAEMAAFHQQMHQPLEEEMKDDDPREGDEWKNLRIEALGRLDDFLNSETGKERLRTLGE